MIKIAVIGECMIELSKQEQNLYKQAFSGDTVNFGIYFKRSLENSIVECVTVVGNDTISEHMLDFFKNEQLKTTYIVKSKTKSPGLYMIDTNDGERSFTYWRNDSSAKELFLEDSLKKISNNLLDYDLIYFSAITIAIMSSEGRKNLFEMLTQARKNNVKIAYDSNYRVKLYNSKDDAKILHNQALQYCDIFLPSFDDEKLLWGDISTDEIIQKAKKYGSNEIIIKCGSSDVVYHHDNSTKKFKIKNLSKVIDSTSAGDSFNGGYLSARLENKDIETSILRASELASKVIMHKGAIIPKDIHE